mmetsp:Transcript_68293/g.114787  ORF Transcript_68293/g.114787 Transcript_68293/m.114787 type:complete len:219 (-) Transcript_68293:92-748(-)
MDPTPAEQRAIALQTKQAEQEQRQENTKAKIERQESKGGFFSKVSAAATDYASKAEKAARTAYSSAEVQAFKLAEEHSIKRFNTAFPALASTDQLKGDHSCRVVTSGGAPHTIGGFLVVTDFHVCFVGDNKVNFSFPLSDVVSIQKAVTLPTKDQGQPYLLQLPDPNIIPTAITVYTMQKQMHVFSEVTKCEDALNILDHCWRAVVGKPPIPGADYVA